MVASLQHPYERDAYIKRRHSGDTEGRLQPRMRQPKGDPQYNLKKKLQKQAWLSRDDNRERANAASRKNRREARKRLADSLAAIEHMDEDTALAQLDKEIEDLFSDGRVSKNPRPSPRSLPKEHPPPKPKKVQTKLQKQKAEYMRRKRMDPAYRAEEDRRRCARLRAKSGIDPVRDLWSTSISRGPSQSLG